MVNFIIVRHGFSAYNKERRYTGQRDIDLDPIGREQAIVTGRYILENYSVDAVYASDLRRAVETAKPVADALGLPVIPKKSLREISLGCFEDHLIDRVREEFPERFVKSRTENGYCRLAADGESYAEVVGRAISEINLLARRHDGETVLIASHGGCIRAMLIHWLGIPLENMRGVPIVPNASITTGTWDNGKMTLEQIGFTGHLKDSSCDPSVL